MTPSASGSGPGSNPGDWDPQDFLARLNERIDADEPPARGVAPRRAASRFPRTHWLTAVAASAAIVATGGLALLLTVTQRAARAGREYVAAAGRRESVMLPDGTQFMLAPGSRLRLDPEYGRHRRDVYLIDGAGYFVVAHDGRRPFAVHAHQAVIEDIGTQFVVRGYADEPSLDVTVAEGMVAMQGTSGRPGPSLRVVAGAGAHVDGSGAMTLTPAADVAQALAWTRGELVFNATPLSEVARAMTRWYGVPVAIADSARARLTYTGSFTTEPLDDVVAHIAAATGTTYERRAGVFTIKAH
jgi:transmembrane sensor